MTTARVSVVVPSFNEPPEVLGAALGSLKVQTFRDFECIVVDESTEARSASFGQAFCAADARFHYIRPAHRIGLAASLNLGIESACGELIARFDADDVANPVRLERQVAFLDEHPQVGLVGSDMEIVDDEGWHTAFRRYPTDHTAIRRAMQTTNAVAHPTVMYRRSVVDAHGRYDPTFRYSEDLELWLRWLNAGVVFANLGQPLVRYRQARTVRGRAHWESNLRARRLHFAGDHLARRLLGLGALALWMAVPAGLQERAYRRLMLQRTVLPANS